MVFLLKASGFQPGNYLDKWGYRAQATTTGHVLLSYRGLQEQRNYVMPSAVLDDAST
jgi:hypothetical protein